MPILTCYRYNWINNNSVVVKKVGFFTNNFINISKVHFYYYRYAKIICFVTYYALLLRLTLIEWKYEIRLLS